MTTQSTIVEPDSISANAGLTTIKPKRYHFALVALHWLIAIMIFGTVFLIQGNEEGRERFEGQRRNFPQQGYQQGNPSQNFQSGNQTPGFPQEGFPARGAGQGVLSTTGIHMIIGFTILILLIARLIVRWTTRHPDWASAGNKFFDWIGNLTHIGLYLLTFAVVITGIILADQRGVLARTFGIGSTPTPGGFGRGGFRLGFLHGGMWTLLLLLIVLHIGAALYHQFILKDNLLGRMWFGKATD